MQTFLDIVNPILWNFLEKNHQSKLEELEMDRDKPQHIVKMYDKFKCQVARENLNRDQSEKLTPEAIVKDNPLNYLLFYSSQQLFNLDSSAGKMMSLVLRRNLQLDLVDPGSIMELNPIEQYSYLIRIYLSRYSTVEELERIVAQIGSSTIANLILLSKYVYLRRYDSRGKSLAKSVLIEIDDYIKKYHLQLPCLYIYLYKCIVSTSTSGQVEEYENFYRQITPSSNSNNIYLRLILRAKRSDNYPLAVSLMLSTPSPYHHNILEFFEYYEVKNLNYLRFGEDLKNIYRHLHTISYFGSDRESDTQEEKSSTITPLVLEFKRVELENKRRLEKNSKEVLQVRFKAVIKKIDRKIARLKKSALRDIARADIDSIEIYKDNIYLPDTLRSLIEMAVGEKKPSRDFISDFKKSMSFSEPLAVRFLQTHMSANMLDKDTILRVFEIAVSSMKSRYCAAILQDSIIDNTNNTALILTICEKRESYEKLRAMLLTHTIGIDSLSNELLAKVLDGIKTTEDRLNFLVASCEDGNLLYLKAEQLKYGEDIVKKHLNHFMNMPLEGKVLDKILSHISVKKKSAVSFIRRRSRVDIESLGTCIFSTDLDLEKVKDINQIIKEHVSIVEYYKYLDYVLKNHVLQFREYTGKSCFFDGLMIERMALSLLLESEINSNVTVYQHLVDKYSRLNASSFLDESQIEILGIIHAYDCCFNNLLGDKIPPNNLESKFIRLQRQGFHTVKKIDLTNNYSDTVDFFITASFLALRLHQHNLSLVKATDDTEKSDKAISELKSFFLKFNRLNNLRGLLDITTNSHLLTKLTDMLTMSIDIMTDREVGAGKVDYKNLKILLQILAKLKPSIYQLVDENFNIKFYTVYFNLNMRSNSAESTTTMQAHVFTLHKLLQLTLYDHDMGATLTAHLLGYISGVLIEEENSERTAFNEIFPIFLSYIIDNRHTELNQYLKNINSYGVEDSLVTEVAENLCYLVYLAFGHFIDREEVLTRDRLIKLADILLENNMLHNIDGKSHNKIVSFILSVVECSCRDADLKQFLSRYIATKNLVGKALLHRASSNRSSAKSSGNNDNTVQPSIFEQVTCSVSRLKKFITSKLSF